MANIFFRPPSTVNWSYGTSPRGNPWRLIMDIKMKNIAFSRTSRSLGGNGLSVVRRITRCIFGISKHAISSKSSKATPVCIPFKRISWLRNSFSRCGHCNWLQSNEKYDRLGWTRERQHHSNLDQRYMNSEGFINMLFLLLLCVLFSQYYLILKLFHPLIFSPICRNFC